MSNPSLVRSSSVSGNSSSSGSSTSSSSTTNNGDTAFIVDHGKIGKLKNEKPWERDVKYFKKVKVSAVAAMKMTTHASAGVEKGLKSMNHLPIEIMGLIQGHIDTNEPHCIIVTDVFPLPVEGTETTVMSDNPEVMNYMISLGDSLEATREEHFIGWYHSHPFDVGAHSNCFLSATDVSTQLSWQLSEDRAGNPWLALVVDPLRGISKGRPEIGAFRCYPPNYTPPRGTAPDGEVWDDERLRNARWGESCISYYQLDVEYFMSSASASLMGMIARDFMWTRVLSSTPVYEKEAQERLPERLHRISEKIETANLNHTINSSSTTVFGGMAGFGGAIGGIGNSSSSSTERQTGSTEITEADVTASELATELLRGNAAVEVKKTVFEQASDSTGKNATRLTKITINL